MLFTELDVPGAHLIEPKVYGDNRGEFLEWFRGDVAERELGRRVEVAQANVSVSAAKVLRGIHFADVPLGQAKLVSVMYGAITDYIVDLRVESPTYGKWEAVDLDATSHRMVFLAEGLGHAFVSHQEGTVVSYLVTDVFRPDAEHGVDPFDGDLDIRYPYARDEMALSEKDLQSGSLKSHEEAGRLPTWLACQARYSALAPKGSEA